MSYKYFVQKKTYIRIDLDYYFLFRGLILSVLPLVADTAFLVLPLATSLLKTGSGTFSTLGYGLVAFGGYEGDPTHYTLDRLLDKESNHSLITQASLMEMESFLLLEFYLGFLP